MDGISANTAITMVTRPSVTMTARPSVTMMARHSVTMMAGGSGGAQCMLLTDPRRGDTTIQAAETSRTDHAVSAVL